MITVKKPAEIEKLRAGGKRLAMVLRDVREAVKIGMTARELDHIAKVSAEQFGDEPAFLNYKPSGAKRPFPASLCVSVNDEVVHGIPNESQKILLNGDIVSVDMGLIHDKLYTDSAITLPVGKVDVAGLKLIEVTEKALYEGIKAAIAGNHVGDIGFAIESFIKPYGFGIVRELAGHGVGYKVHEDPYIPNFGKKGEGAELKPGMVIAIEPMVNEGAADVMLDDDGYTFRTKDGKRSAHFEHTVLITEDKPVILTAL